MWYFQLSADLTRSKIGSFDGLGEKTYLTPRLAISIIWTRIWWGSGRPLMNIPPSWLTRPWNCLLSFYTIIFCSSFFVSPFSHLSKCLGIKLQAPTTDAAKRSIIVLRFFPLSGRKNMKNKRELAFFLGWKERVASIFKENSILGPEPLQ